MSLFDAAVAQVVKDVGDKTLIPVSDRSSSEYSKIFFVVECKTYPWHLPWKPSKKYIPCKVDLNDLLVEPVDLKNLVSSSTLLENYESTPSFHISGKIGGKIADEFEVDLSVNETLQVLMKLGKIVKKEISWQNLYDKLNNRKMKVDHPLLKAINKSKRRSLCLISMVVTSGSEMNLDEDKDVGGQGDLGVTPQVALNLNNDDSSDSKQHRQYCIPHGTCLGYSCYDIKLDKYGTLNLKLGEDVVDKGASTHDENLNDGQDMAELNGLLQASNSGEIITKLKKILKYRSNCAFMLRVVVEGALDNLEGEHVNRMTVAQLKTEFHEDSTEICFELLEEVGFQISKESLTYPEDSSKLPLLKSLYLLLDSIAELSNSQIGALTECDISHRFIILHVIKKVVESEVVRPDDTELEGMFSGDNPGRTFLKSIGFDLINNGGPSPHVQFVPEKSELLHVYSTQISVYGICSV